MSRARLADINHADKAALSGGTWSAELPLDNLKDPRMRSRPARCEDATDLNASQFDAALDRTRAVTMVALLFHSLSLSALVRLRIAADDAFTTVVHDSGWTDVYPRLFPSLSLPWEAENWWTGQPVEDDIDLHPRHRPLRVPAGTLGQYLRIEIDDSANPDGWFDIGFLFIAEAWSPAMNFEHGRTLGLESRSVVHETPSGRELVERRPPRRTHRVSFADLSRDEAMRIFDMGARAGVSRPVLFVPDEDDAINLWREAFPARFAELPSPTFNLENLHAVGLSLKEIIA